MQQKKITQFFGWCYSWKKIANKLNRDVNNMKIKKLEKLLILLEDFAIETQEECIKQSVKLVNQTLQKTLGEYNND